MTDELISNLELSERTRNICRYNGLLTIKQLSIYYKRYNSFLNLRNCGEKSNLELIALINPDKDSYNNSAVNWSTILIEDIYHMGCLSERSKNVCLNNDIHTFKDLLKVYKIHTTFLKFQNCGRKSNEELLSLIFSKKEDIKQILEKPNISESNFLKEYSNKLTQNQIEIIIKNKFNTFLKDSPGSSKFRNILIKFIYHPYHNKQPKDKLFTYVNTLVNNRKKIDSEISKQKSVGTSKVRSIYLFHTDLIKEIQTTFENLDEDELEYINELLIFEEKFNLRPNIEILNYFKSNKINVINTTTFILESKYQRDKEIKKLHIFKEIFIKSNKSNLESISASLDTSSERCRQIAKIIESDIKNTIDCLQEIYPSFINYEFLNINKVALLKDVSSKLKYETENVFMIKQLIESLNLIIFSPREIFKDINYSYALSLIDEKEFIARNSVFDEFKEYLINCLNSIINVGFVNITMIVSKSFSNEIEESNNLKSKINIKIANEIYKIIGEKAAQKIYYKSGEIAIENKRKYIKSKLRTVDFTRIDVISNRFSKTKLWDNNVKEIINSHIDIYHQTIAENDINRKINIISENIYSTFKNCLITKEFYFQKNNAFEIYRINISNKFIVDDILESFSVSFSFEEFMERVNKKYFFKSKIKEVSIRAGLLNHPDSINFGNKGMFIKRNEEFTEDSYNTKDLCISFLKSYNHPLRIKSLEKIVLEKNLFIKRRLVSAIINNHKDIFKRFTGTGYVGIYEKDYLEIPIKMPIKKINTYLSKSSLETNWIYLSALHVFINEYASAHFFQIKDYLDENNYLEINGLISEGFKTQEKNKTIEEVVKDEKLEKIIKNNYINLNINNRISFKKN